MIICVVPVISGFAGPRLIFPPRRWIMAVEGLGNLVQNVADHLFRQGPAAQATAHVLGARDGGDAPPGGDTFTPSTQSDSAHTTTQDAGIFQVSQGALTEVTANILFVQTNSGTDQIAFPAQNATGAAANLARPGNGRVGRFRR